MDSDNQEKIYCDDDGDCLVSDKLETDRYCNNHLKSQTNVTKFSKTNKLQMFQRHIPDYVIVFKL